MVAPHNIDEKILVQLDEPLQHQLQEELQRVVAQGSAASTPRSRVGETTPLVLKAGDLAVSVDAVVDLDALDRQLRHEELEALHADQALPALDIVREEAASLIKISVPMTGSVLVETLGGIVLGMLLGNVSTDSSTAIIAASSLSDVAVAQVTVSLMGGLRYALDTMCAQSIGAKQYTQLWLYVQAGLLAMTYSVPFIVIIVGNGSPILTLLGQDPELASLASFFMRLSLLSLPFSISLALMTCVLTAQGITLPFTIASSVSFAISLPLAYVLGYKTSLGYVGIPISSFVNVLIQNIIIACVLAKNSVFVDAWPGWQLAKAHVLAKKLWPLGVSSILMVVFQSISFNIVSMLCGLLPNAAIAISTSSIGLNWINLASLPLQGFFAGGAVRVGTALGGGQPHRAMIASHVTLVVTLLAALFAVIVCAMFADSFTHAYTTDRATATAATNLIYAMLPIIPLMACNLTAQAVFRACAKQLLSAQLNFITLVAFGVPVGCLLGFELSWGAAGLWTGQTLGFVVFALAAAVWILRQDWKQLAHAARLNTHLHVETAYTEPTPEPHAATRKA